MRLLLMWFFLALSFSAYAEIDADALYIWHESTLPAAEGKVTYHLGAMTYSGQLLSNVVLTTNAGEGRISSIGSYGANRYQSFELTSLPVKELRISAAKADEKNDLLGLLKTGFNQKISKTTGKEHPNGIWPFKFAESKKKVSPDPSLNGKKISVSLAPVVPANNGVGVFVFSLDGEPGLPVLEDIEMKVVVTPQYQDDLDLLETGRSGAGTWYAELRYEGFLEYQDHFDKYDRYLVAPRAFVISKMTGVVAGKRINLMPSLQRAPFKPLAITIER